MLDLDKGCVSVLQEKIVALESKVEAMAAQKYLLAWVLASVTGKLIAMKLGIGHVTTRLHLQANSNQFKLVQILS